MNMQHYKIDFQALPWQTPMTGVRFKAAVQDGRRLRVVEYTPAMEPHWCEKGHIGRILDGAFEIRFDRETVVFSEGDGVFIPPGREHRHMARALSEIVTVVFVEDA
jgi:mannose-6-phosphate isomerase-like protein (cupin superfamily)